MKLNFDDIDKKVDHYLFKYFKHENILLNMY